MKILSSVLIFFLHFAATAQISTSIDVRLPGIHGFGETSYKSSSAIGEQEEVAVDENEINGSAFWKNDWNKAYVFLPSGSIVKLNQAKLNLKNNQLYFFDSNHVLKAANESAISKIIFIDKKDSLKTLGVFQKLLYDGYTYFQVLNAGDCQLLKAIKIDVIKRDYNPILNKDEYKYESKPVYYLFYSDKLSQIDVLNKENLVSVIKVSEENNNWLAQNKNKLKGETDWVSFLNYYNSKQ